MEEREEPSEKEKRIRAITRIYYSNPKVQAALFQFAKDREVVPRYFEGFGKRPDTIQYPSDIIGLVNKGATSFHASEEIWQNPLEINSEMSADEMNEIRKSWDLLLDIDSPFFDYSKIAAKLIVEELERHGVNSYGIKFSGSKGLHIIVPAEAFPKTFQDKETRKMFPEWPRAIVEYLMHQIKSKYNKVVGQQNINFEAVQDRTNLTKEDLVSINCPNCNSKSIKKNSVIFKCNRCSTIYEKPDYTTTKRKLKCTDESCPGFFDIVSEKEYFFCEKCKTSSLDKKYSSDKKVTYTKDAKSDFSANFHEEVSGEKIAFPDMILVSPRHLFRMPYSLHEKTALASVVLSKSELDSFSPKDANPLKAEVKDFYPKAKENEARLLLQEALAWKKGEEEIQERTRPKVKYENYGQMDFSNVTEDMFPQAIKKLLKGLPEGKKRGLFILLTFYRSLNFSPEYINEKVREWNKKNTPPLKEGYVRSQIEWHLRQKKKILPPNYKNESFYKDLKLIDAMPADKNPLSEVMRKLRKSKS